jgi:hypothetical protein
MQCLDSSTPGLAKEELNLIATRGVAYIFIIMNALGVQPPNLISINNANSTL